MAFHFMQQVYVIGRCSVFLGTPPWSRYKAYHICPWFVVAPCPEEPSELTVVKNEIKKPEIYASAQSLSPGSVEKYESL